MSATTEARRAAPWVRALALVLPGTRQVAAGRWGSGLCAMVIWSMLVLVAIVRRERIPVTWSDGIDGRIAVLTLAFVLAGVWGWAWRDATRPRGGQDRPSPLRLTMRSLSRNPAAVLGLGAIVGLVIVAFLTPLLAPFDPNAQGSLIADRFLAPSALHPLGTDNLARDVLSRLLYGARISLSIGLLAMSISVTLGTLLGAVAGYLGGWVDTVVMRAVDIVLSFPRLVLLITIVALFEPSIFLIVAVLGLTLWPSTARLVRGEVLSLRERAFIQAAEALGFSRRRIVFGHLVPNALGPVIVAATLGIGDTIVLEAGLSFLGLGVQAPTASWGSMVDAGRVNLLGAWWISTFPGLAIVATVLAFNVVGDGLRDALDPRLRS